jgi:sec-independent protein translocase protein TatC
MLQLHTYEIKFRFLYSILNYILNSSILWYFHTKLIGYLIPFHLIFTSITEAFYASIQFTIIMSFFYTIPFLYWQVYEFILPGLYEHERDDWIHWKTILIMVSFIILIFKEVILLIIQFFTQFQSEYLTLTLTFTHFISFINQTFFILIVIFIIPLLIKYLRKYFIRKFNYFICLILLAFVTPPDVVSLLFTFIPIFLLTEIILFYYIVKDNILNNSI